MWFTRIDIVFCVAHIWRCNKSKRKVKRQANFIKRDFMFIPEIRFSVLLEWMVEKEAAGYNGSNWPERGWWCLFWHGFFSLAPFHFFLSFLIFRSRFYLSEEFSHFHMSAFSFLSQSCQSPSTESQLSPLKYAFRDPHGCFHSSFIFPLSDLVLLNDTVCFL